MKIFSTLSSIEHRPFVNWQQQSSKLSDFERFLWYPDSSLANLQNIIEKVLDSHIKKGSISRGYSITEVSTGQNLCDVPVPHQPRLNCEFVYSNNKERKKRRTPDDDDCTTVNFITYAPVNAINFRYIKKPFS